MAAAMPVVRVLGPRRNVGKTWLASRLIETLVARGYAVGAIKRSHHVVPPDRAGSDTALFAEAGASPVVFAAGDATLTRGTRSTDLGALVAELPPTLDVVVVEGFKSDTLGARIDILPDEAPPTVQLRTMEGDLAYEGPMTDVEQLADCLRCVLDISTAGSEVTRAGIRRAAVSHGHRCPGLTLGVRMAAYASELLGIALDPAPRDLVVQVETARCATDAIAAMTGCTTGSRRLRVAEYGKLAATFSIDGRAVRLAARAGLRERACLDASCEHGAHAQDEAYRSLADEELFTVQRAAPLPALNHHRGGRRLCEACGEEVALAALRLTSGGPRCVACAAVERTHTPSLVSAR